MTGEETQKKNDQVDLYRDTPVRLLGYSNEVGEAFRALVHRNAVRFSYAVAFAYVFADTADKTKKVNDTDKKIIAGADVLIWQTLASVAIPGFTINRICALSAILLRRTALGASTQKWTTTALGLSSIPLIIKPIDHFVDYLMENTYRRFITRRKCVDSVD